MKKIFSFLFLLFTIVMNSQNFLITNDGEKIDYEKGEFKGDNLKIIINDTVKLIPAINIYANYNSREILKYIKPKLENNKKQKFEFVNKIIDGPIKIYRKKEIIHSSLVSGYEASYWYLEKDNLYFDIGTTGNLINIKTSNLEKFKSTIEDDLQLLDLVNDKKFKSSVENILEIVRKYNCKHYNAVIQNKTNQNKVFFFREGRKQNKEIAILEINNKKYFLDRNSKFEINLSFESPTIIKINNQFCELIKASEFYTKYYEISFNKKKENSINERNGNSKYIKTRFKYFEKKATK